MAVSNRLEEDILTSLRRITRAIDLHSRYLANTFGLTGPQLVCLRVLGRLRQTTPHVLAQQVALSQATVTGIVDRLAARQLVTRERSVSDRRLVEVTITPAGEALLAQAPSALQETFLGRLAQLPLRKQEAIGATLREVVRMMGSEDLDASPVLSIDSRAPAEIGEPLAAPPGVKRAPAKSAKKKPAARARAGAGSQGRTGKRRPAR